MRINAYALKKRANRFRSTVWNESRTCAILASVLPRARDNRTLMNQFKKRMLAQDGGVRGRFRRTVVIS